MRRVAVEALGKRKPLPDAVLTAVPAQLNDGNCHMRLAVAEALSEREALPDVVLSAVAARLDDEDSHVRTAALNVVIKIHKGGCQNVFNESLTTYLYKNLLQRSFVEQASLYIKKALSHASSSRESLENSFDQALQPRVSLDASERSTRITVGHMIL